MFAATGVGSIACSGSCRDLRMGRGGMREEGEKSQTTKNFVSSQEFRLFLGNGELLKDL